MSCTVATHLKRKLPITNNHFFLKNLVIMHSLKKSFLISRILMTSSKLEFHTDVRLHGRKFKSRKETDFSNIRELLENEPESLKNSDLEESVEDLEEEKMNFMESDLAYDSHRRESKRWKDRVGKMIAVKKYFAPAKQPMMLTYNEKMCIKYLHEQDPIQWDVHTLSESFPATPDIISKVLKSKWRISQQRIMKMDTKVQENWKLLEEGKLDANAEVIEHLKKFVNRREILLEQIKNSNFYLPEVKKEKEWNHGEMSSILESYEKSIKELEKKHFQKLKDQFISDGIKLEVQQENYTNEKEKLMHANLNQKKEKLDVKEKESSSLGEMLQYFANSGTSLDQKLQNDTFSKLKERKHNLSEIAILEDKLQGERKTSLKYKHEKNNKSYKEESKAVLERKITNLPKALFKKETSLIIEEEADKNNIDKYKKLYKKFPLISQEVAENFLGDEKTIIMTESEAGNALNNKMLKKEQTIEKSKSVKRFEELVNNDPERLVRDQIYNEKIVNEIKDTAFWNNGKNSEKKQMLEYEKKFLGDPQDIEKITRANVSMMDSYPEKIKIPKSKRGSGLIFKVKDCYYDDDGEFLYRVPGMMK